MVYAYPQEVGSTEATSHGVNQLIHTNPIGKTVRIGTIRRRRGTGNRVMSSSNRTDKGPTHAQPSDDALTKINAVAASGRVL